MPQSHPLWRAEWIWPAGERYPYNAYAQFRRDFTLGRPPRRAPLWITADQSYMLYVNGAYVGRGPARGFQRWWPYDEHDLAPYLRRGHNWLSVRAFNGGVSTYGYVHQATAGVLVAARWPGFDLVSGPDWRSRLSPAYRPAVARATWALNFQEQVDARLDDQDWIRSPRPPRWPGKTGARPGGVMPWHSFEPRGAANLGNEVKPYLRACTAAAGRCAPGHADVPNVSPLMRGELAKLRWTAAPPARRHGERLAATMPAIGPGKFAALTLDQGEPGVGTLLVEAVGARGGEILDCYFGEQLRANGSPVLAVGVDTAARLRLAAGRTRHELFQMMGHRFLTLVLRDAIRPVKLALALRETIYPFRVVGRFACNDQAINDIHRIAVRTQRVCALDSYVDTPWREQGQWWGDARVQARNTFHLCADDRLLARGIRCLARQEVPNGLTYGLAPSCGHGNVLPDFSLIWAITIWDHWWQNGSLDLFREQWPRIERLLGYFAGEGRECGRHGLLGHDRRYWLFLDWTDLHKAGVPTLLNLWYLYALEKLAELAGLAGMKTEQRQLRRRHGEQKRLIIKWLWDRKRGLMRDGLRPDGRPVPVRSVHNQALALLAGLAPDGGARMRERLLAYLRGRQVPGAQPSSYWVTYVYSAMTGLGHGASVLRHLRRNFAPMIPYGGTWEAFAHDENEVWTSSHAWSAHPIYHLPETLGGIRQAAPGWRRIVFAPVLDLKEVEHATATVPTPLGPIRSQWRKDKAGKVKVDLALPEKMIAEVHLPGLPLTEARGRNEWLVKHVI